MNYEDEMFDQLIKMTQLTKQMIKIESIALSICFIKDDNSDYVIRCGMQFPRFRSDNLTPRTGISWIDDILFDQPLIMWSVRIPKDMEDGSDVIFKSIGISDYPDLIDKLKFNTRLLKMKFDRWEKHKNNLTSTMSHDTIQ